MSDVKRSEFKSLPIRDELKTCQTCRYRLRELCMRTGVHWVVMRQTSCHEGTVCDKNFSGWQRKVRRRSIRQWLQDVFLG